MELKRKIILISVKVKAHLQDVAKVASEGSAFRSHSKVFGSYGVQLQIPCPGVLREYTSLDRFAKEAILLSLIQRGMLTLIILTRMY